MIRMTGIPAWFAGRIYYYTRTLASHFFLFCTVYYHPACSSGRLATNNLHRHLGSDILAAPPRSWYLLDG